MDAGPVSGARAVILRVALAALLVGPTVLAFFTGGYFDVPREWAGLVAWVLVAIGFATARQPLPRSRAAWMAIGGLALLATWTLLSITWGPIAGSAYHAGQLVMLYLGTLLAATALLGDRPALCLVEPALAAGAVIVIGYGISERLLPGVLHFARSLSAQGRLEQPLTYWNAIGELAALGFVVCARIAGDRSRPRRLRAGATAAAAPLGMGLYLSFSRGALFACVAGLVALVVLAPRREQWRAITASVVVGALGALASAPFRGVTALAGAQSTRERQGAIALVLLVLVTVAAGLFQARLARHEDGAELRLPRQAPMIATAVICAGLALAIVAGAKERSGRPLSAGATRLTTLQSNRYAYWRVALRAFEEQPLRGVGAGGWAVYWLRYRPFDEFAQDAHSLPLQTLAELGLVGALLLLLFLAGVAAAAREALRGAPAVAAGPIAALVVYIAHAPLDWDWQMPAVTLVGMLLAGGLLAMADGAGERELTTPRRSAVPRG